MAINAAYELPYTGREVEELLGKVTSNETAIEQLEESVDGKVDKSDGKGLSSNDYTTEEKDKLNGIASGAEVNVQADWNDNDSSSDSFIKNKPSIPTKTSDLTNDSGFNVGTITGITMNGVSKGTSGVVNLGTVITSHQDISNKANRSDAIGTLSLSMNSTNYQITLSGTKVDGTAFTVSSVIDLPLESVVVSGTYNNTTKKVILTLQNGSTVEFSVADLVSGLQTEITSTNKLSADLISDGVTNKVVTSTEKSTWNNKSDFSGNYNDLTNKPTIPDELSDLSDDSTHRLVTDTEKSTWNAKQSALTFDTTPTANSTNPVTSAGIKAYVDNATPTITMDDTPTSGSNNPVKSGGVYTALQGKQNTLTFDSTPTASSTNPVTSGGVKTALDLKANQSTTYTKTEVDALFDDVAYLGDDDGSATTLDFDPQADTVWNIPQTLGSSQQAQARANIGVVDVSGTNDGTNWTSITIGSTTKAIPSGGGGGETNVIESISINGTTQTVTNKNVDLPVPVSSTITAIVSLTEAQYTALTTKDSSTLYIILES